MSDTIWDKPWYRYPKFGESNWNPPCVIVVANSADNNYVPNEHILLTNTAGPYAIPSENNPTSLVNQIKFVLSYCANELICHSLYP